jgi:hypothetical protein
VVGLGAALEVADEAGADDAGADTAGGADAAAEAEVVADGLTDPDATPVDAAVRVVTTASGDPAVVQAANVASARPRPTMVSMVRREIDRDDISVLSLAAS